MIDKRANRVAPGWFFIVLWVLFVQFFKNNKIFLIHVAIILKMCYNILYNNLEKVRKLTFSCACFGAEVCLMKRKMYDTLLKWKNSKDRTAVLIDGARRVGKSYIAEEFAKENYKSYILIDFNIAPKEVTDLFNYNLHDLDTFFMGLSTFYHTRLYERDTLIIFDEVELFPKARAAIKYLVADGRYDFIETGSLMSIKKNVKDILIPSEEWHIKMYPMDFEEFLWAMGDETFVPYIKDCFEKKKPVGQLIHRKAMEYFRQYMMVGGMPQAVSRFIETRNFEDTDLIKRKILLLYRDDIAKHSERNEFEIESIFDEIPAQLSKHEKKFKLSDIRKGARSRDYKQPFN